MKTRVTTKKFGDVTALVYRYGADDWGFEFHLLCEVGEPWKPNAKALALALAEELDCDIKTVELDAAPWVVDSLVKRRK